MSFAIATSYVSSRTRDSIALSHEIQAASKGSCVADLGYCVILPSNVVSVREYGSTSKEYRFNSPTEARAFILATFW